LSGQLLGGYVPFATRTADNQTIDDPTRARLDLFLSTALLSFSQGTGFGAEVQLPMGIITTSTLAMPAGGTFTIGDLEARGRYARRWSAVRLQGSVGAAFPTGPSIARGGEAAVLEAARYLTLGRGVVWGLGDLDVRVTLPATLSLFLSSTLRVPLGATRDAFQWGTELRGTAGLAAGPWFDRRLAASLGFETQWRAQSRELDPFSATLVESVNTGGLWCTLTPAVSLRVVDGVRVFASGRIPVGQVVNGLQFVPGPGVFVGVGGTMELIAPPATRVEPQRGKVTVVEYGATWCEPCRKLEPLLDAFSVKRPEVLVRKTDASDWSAEQMERILPGVAGLPVVEVFGADGSLVRRLVGEEVFGFEAVVEELK
jgi:thiol-disulfide isomerase/thioredoxin